MSMLIVVILSLTSILSLGFFFFFRKENLVVNILTTILFFCTLSVFLYHQSANIVEAGYGTHYVYKNVSITPIQSVENDPVKFYIMSIKDQNDTSYAFFTEARDKGALTIKTFDSSFTDIVTTDDSKPHARIMKSGQLFGDTVLTNKIISVTIPTGSIAY